ncbi:MAG: FAD-binding protein, partial [Nanoarchaeota archaeon]
MAKHEAIIIGGGLAGLSAALAASKSGMSDIAIVSKLHPLRSNAVAAQGGIAASIGNSAEDSWIAHMEDTVKGGDYLNDQDAVEILVKEASSAVYGLEHIGVLFNRDENGMIAQRAFGGHSKPRACYAKDTTGHSIQYEMFAQALKDKIKIYDEYYATSLIIEDSVCKGLTAYNIKTGEIEAFEAKAVMMATGGFAQVYQTTTASTSSTGDGLNLALKSNIPLMDMEFVQFHPTGIYGKGTLVSEAARGEGGHLKNGLGERFMAKYSPQMMELAPRDVVTKAIQTEINLGHGINRKDYVYLDLRHLGRDKIMGRLPFVRESVISHLGIDCVTQQIPIKPTAHYTMGGIPTTTSCEVYMDGKETVKGLYAAGECACVSLQGANRLGCNSLLDCMVFGNIAGRAMAEYASSNDTFPTKEDYAKIEKDKISRMLS